MTWICLISSYIKNIIKRCKVLIMVFVHSKTIINKLDEAHGLIITYPEFKVTNCEDFKTDDKIGICYKIEADAYIDYIIGICDVLDMKYDFECEDGELYDIRIYLTK